MEPAEHYAIYVKLDKAQTDRIKAMADERGLTIEEFVNQEVQALREPEPFRVAAPEDVRYIVVRGIPENYHSGFEQAKARAVQLTEETQSPTTVMAVHKHSVEIAVTAVYHGVQVHAIAKARELVEGED